MKIGFVGCGNISGIYLSNITGTFRNLEVAGVCDLVREKAENQAKAYGVTKIYKDMYELFADPEVDIVLNITRPNDHYGVTKAALLAGKHVYSEKPLATDLDKAKELVALAKEKGLYLGGAPDTFMGAGIQTARRLIDEGAIGKIVGANVFFLGRGPEGWHPDPEFFYKAGGGPMLDMGPYYVTTLVNLLGEADSVMAYGRISFPQRVIGSEPHKGDVIDVEVDTFSTGAIRFTSGAVASLTVSFDSYTDRNEFIEIYGETGSIHVPDPNTFGGDVLIKRGNAPYEKVELDPGFTVNSRALGLSEMVDALEEGRLHRANYMQQLHVLEIMLSFQKSSRSNAPVAIESHYERQPAVVPTEIKAEF
ncbi:MAG: Gfo/Idh/MocA family oxidoreductase [Clostridia bacterium]|nr:Gfo/Idh/MocA family oxidoreductase [Clostridia bacterium]